MHRKHMHTHAPMHHNQTRTHSTSHTCTHMHTYSPGALLTCAHVLKHKVRAVSLSSCSGSPFPAALGRKGCSPASGPCVCSPSSGRPGRQSLCLRPQPTTPGSAYEGTLSPSVPVTHPLWNLREKANSRTTLKQPGLSCFLPWTPTLPPASHLTPVYPGKPQAPVRPWWTQAVPSCDPTLPSSLSF